MSILEAGRVTDLVFCIISFAAISWYLWQATQGKEMKLRTMEQVEAIEDGVDRAVEENRPVYVEPGCLVFLSGTRAPIAINGMNVLRYTARLCVRKGARVILPVPFNPETYPLIDGIFREVAVSEGVPEAYRPEDVRYYGNTEASFSVGASTDIARTSASLVVMVGSTTSSEIYMSGVALSEGATVIYGNTLYALMGAAACMAHYSMYGDDVFGAGAICSGDNEVRSTMLGGDLTKLIIVALILISAILAAAGLPIVSEGGWMFQ